MKRDNYIVKVLIIYNMSHETFCVLKVNVSQRTHIGQFKNPMEVHPCLGTDKKML